MISIFTPHRAIAIAIGLALSPIASFSNPVCSCGIFARCRPSPAEYRHHLHATIIGYADIGPFGATAYKTPHLDRMAAEGRIFTDFHSATAVCSASRAGLLTGCYPERVSILGALNAKAKVGINADEITLAELCRTRGYATAIYGKWHLGHHQQFLPLQHGFDEYFGLPYSNDMSPLQAEMIKGILPQEAERKRKSPPLPLFENNEIIDPAVTPEKLAQLTTLYTEHAVSFIDRHKDQPFLLYVPHTMVHVPLAVSEKFKDKSGAGLFGDVVMELDWSVGQILGAIGRNGLDDNTLVIFTSDNGPWLNYGNHAGSAGPLREGKGTMWEGGYREPCVMRWPGRIPAGTTCDELASTLDVFPTVAKLIGADMPTDRAIDGSDIWPLMAGENGAKSPHDGAVLLLRSSIASRARSPLEAGPAPRIPQPRRQTRRPRRQSR